MVVSAGASNSGSGSGGGGGVCGVLSNAAINYGLVSGWLGKRAVLSRWGHVSITADGPGSPLPPSLPLLTTTNSQSSTPFAAVAADDDDASSPPQSPKLTAATGGSSSGGGGGGGGEAGSLCAHLLQQVEMMCGQLCYLQQDVEHAVFERELAAHRRNAQLYVALLLAMLMVVLVVPVVLVLLVLVLVAARGGEGRGGHALLLRL